ncbi:type IV toxin-antitoxin system AbiEi family antitoxin domain-containing protein [Nocardioides carbamazepini]|uniref:type IV toxin-antitoxin system AbiEi family antitoxin domain-containing protein n=1 Tax=Nocardioides carbamazepini TaxID=2854259 RepID=UPI00214A5192|nr:type IV toxin-antitoxin system AbiEi family antitoxin domain-containing protein [Nocardioides carbamazepini]MCR1786517.1 type IV toxin-antitoxin system AbiEi family antitoxin domain-containing protein [Nocardioides carbamazepini]
MDGRDQLAAQIREEQAGLIRRAQLLELGCSPNDIARLIRRRELTSVHDGVYADQTGPLSWHQRSWAAVLACWPAGLRAASAARAADARRRRSADDHRPIEVVVDWTRSLRVPGIDVRRSRRFPHDVDWTTSPPRQLPAQWALDLAAAAANDMDAVAVITDAIGGRQLSASTLSAALAGRTRIRRRAFLTQVVADAGAGTCSTLEHGYLHRVEQAHGLPIAARQVMESAKGTVYRDVVYVAFGLIVELDGRLHHSGIRNRDRDLARDLDAAVAGRETVRLGWGQVFGSQCHTAWSIGQLLNQRGWTGRSTSCPRC